MTMRRCTLLLGLLAAAGPVAAPAAAQAPTLRAPDDAAMPRDQLGDAMRRGRALLFATRDSLPRNVGNALRCVSCHPDGGRRPNAMPWVGVYGRFPQYRSRAGRVILLEDRINDCFERSMNGRALARDGRDMTDIVAYMAFLSRGVPAGATVHGQGLPQLPRLAADTAAGTRLFATQCARCHGAQGAGTPAAPPLWGPQSYNIGAGMARVYTAAAFIRHNMPFDRPGSLTDQQAIDVAAYINSRPRPDFRGKDRDWPNGDAPPDSPYRKRTRSPSR
jgi:thiosulfate dehydrogenase